MEPLKSPTVSRRAVLQGGSAAAALTAFGTLLPPSVHTAMARPAPRGGIKAVEHVVILMQENRSFDHYFGTIEVCQRKCTSSRR